MALPPGPQEPAFVQRARYLTRPIEQLEVAQRRFGDIFTLKLHPNGWVVLASPSAVKALYTAPPGQFLAGAAKVRIFGPLVGKTSSLVTDGEQHLRRRRLLLPYHRGKRMFDYTPMVRELVLHDLRRWPRQTPFSLHERVHHVALQVVLRAIFGRPGNGCSEYLWGQLELYANQAAASPLVLWPSLRRDLGSWSPWGRVLRIVRDTDREIFAEIKRRRRALEEGETQSPDLLPLLLAARHEDGSGLTDQEVRDEVLTLLVAGHEITSMALTWASYGILSRPQVQGRIMAELDAAGLCRPWSDHGEGLLCQDTLAQLPYLDATIKESLRFYSTVPNGSLRVVTQDVELGGYHLPRGTIVTVGLHLLHRHREGYQDGHVFRPGRFLDTKPNPYTWAPFGGGSRRCIGMALALHEMKVVLATLLSQATLQLASKRPVHPVRRGAFLKPAGGLPVTMHDRLAPSTPLRQMSREANIRAERSKDAGKMRHVS